MALLEDPEIRTKDRALKEHVVEIVQLWNRGLYNFKLIVAEPTDTPTGPEIRVYDSGAGVVRLYVFAPGSAQSGVGWWKTGNLTEVT